MMPAINREVFAGIDGRNVVPGVDILLSFIFF